MSYSNSTFDVTQLKFPLNDYNKWITVEQDKDKQLYNLLLSYISANLVESIFEISPSHSLSILPARKKAQTISSTSNTSEIVHGRIGLKIGFGQFSFRSDVNGDTIFALHQKVGDPLGTDCGVKFYCNLVLFTSGSICDLSKFLSSLIEKSEKTEGGTFTCYAWHIKYQYWRHEVRIPARPMDSVVLPNSSKQELIGDLSRFLSPATRSFYARNGIPYRRSYLFYGLAGTGKTSMVQALAGHFERNLCYLMPTHPEMTDDSLRAAVTQLPEDAIVVLEDIDSLFTKDRGSSSASKSALTFSGLLNALDGVGNPNGQIFVLTTNLRDQLDSALIRNGRVDLHIEFTHANEEQMQTMWRNFYPDRTDLAEPFASQVKELLDTNNMKVATAGLQHFFVSQMDSSPDQALVNIDCIVKDILEKAVTDEKKKMEKEEEEKEKEKEKKKKAANKKSNDDDDDVDDDKEDGDEQGTDKKKQKGFNIERLFQAATLIMAVFAIAAIHSRK
jgi:chaperone BCS1